MSPVRAVRPPLSLYVHLPWCVSKCPYCDFNSHPLRGELPVDGYLDSILRDLQAMPDTGDRVLSSIFFGGGTPSLFPSVAIGRIIDAARSRFGFDAGIEITLEANPGSADADGFAGYLEQGVNRLSIGAQSFSDQKLSALGRAHDASDVPRAFRCAREAGFKNLNLDIMFGLPEQDLAEAMADLEAALALEPEHLSWYQLTLEPGTVFHASPPKLPDEDVCWAMSQQGAQLLKQAGFTRYEVSAFTRPGFACRHNMNYWEFGDYLGAGAGAHGKISSPDGSIHRWSMRRSPSLYMAGTGEPWTRRLSAEEVQFEFMLNVLRLTHGFGESLFLRRTGQSAGTIRPRLEAARKKGWMEYLSGEERWRPTPQGMAFLNDVQSLFLPAASP